MSAYEEIVNAVRPLLPSGWRFVGYEDSIDEPDAVTVVLALRSVQRASSAPLGAYLTGWVLQIITPYADPEKADPNLFDDLIHLMSALDSSPDASSFRWTEAQKVVASNRLAFEIPLEALAQKEAD